MTEWKWQSIHTAPKDRPILLYGMANASNYGTAALSMGIGKWHVSKGFDMVVTPETAALPDADKRYQKIERVYSRGWSVPGYSTFRATHWADPPAEFPYRDATDFDAVESEPAA